jgi:hypothetical protein
MAMEVWIAVGLVIGTVLVILGALAAWARIKKRRRHDFVRQLDQMQKDGLLKNYFHEAFLVEHRHLIPTELDRALLEKVEKVGSGQFGEVWKAYLHPHRSHFGKKHSRLPRVVAAKVVKEDIAVRARPPRCHLNVHAFTHVHASCQQLS